MKLTVFHAGDGDCVLVTSSDDRPRRLLIDGGRKAAYAKNARPVLGGLQEAGEKLDLVCVSHIDEDHIAGILGLVEDEVEWRAFDFLKTLDPTARAPRIPRPPEVGEVWHNGLFVLVGDELAPSVEIVLSNVATVLAGSPDERMRELASQLDDLATGERSSMELSRRLSPEQLGIPLNPKSQGALLKRGEPGEKAKFGSLKICVLGPSQDDIDRLRITWQRWIDKHQLELEKLQAEMLEDEERLGTLAPRVVANPLLDQALGEGLEGVTEANLASIMMLVEEDGASVLLTGDGVSQEILAGLEHHGKLDGDGRIHVTALKVQHHGALANVDSDFVKRVTADHYIFCGDGAHHNPELEVVEAFAQARLTGIDGEDPVGPPTAFKFYFSSSSKTPSLSDDKIEHMKAVASTVRRLQKSDDDRLSSKFLTEGSFDIPL